LGVLGLLAVGQEGSMMHRPGTRLLIGWLTLLGGSLLVAVSPLGAAAAPQAAQVLISPMVTSHFAAASQPLTTAQCEKKYGVACYQGPELQLAYNLGPLFRHGITGAGETIVIVDSFGSPTITHDLATYDAQYRLPPPPSFKIIQPAGPVPPYKKNSNFEGWAGETTLDVEMAHTMAPGANILLVETPVSETEGVTGFPQIVRAENYVINHNLGDVISQSFSATEETFPDAASIMALRGAYLNAAAHGVTVLAATGDSGVVDVELNQVTYYTHRVIDWPPSDPLVTAVGGTQLHLNAAGFRTSPDTVWNDTYNVAANEVAFGDAGPNPLATNGGVSSVFARPPYQDGVAGVVGNARGVPDITMSGACNGAVETYQSFPGAPPGWYMACGTSEATPLFAGIVALADQVAGHRLGLINPALYAMKANHAPGLVPVTSGNNTVSFTQDGKSYTVIGYHASAGYNLASGLGTVNAAEFVPTLAAYARWGHWGP
jgi:subtilase family serine protease